MEKILIENFKAIRNESKREIQVNHLTVLMGEQAAGKSTVAKLIYFFKTLPNEFLTEIIDNSSSEKNLYKLFTLRLRRYFIYLFGSTRHLDDFKVSYLYPSGLSLEIYKKKEDGNFYISFPDRLKKEESKIIRYKDEFFLYQDKFDNVSRRERERALQYLSTLISGVFGYEQNSLYMPASRNMTVLLEPFLVEMYSKLENTVSTLNLNDPNRFQSENEFLLLRFMQHTLNMKSKFKRSGDFNGLIEDEIYFSKVNLPLLKKITSRIEDVLKGRYGIDQYGEKIFFKNESFIYLNNASSGQQEVIRPFQDIFLAVLEGEPVFRIYEEPESHLSPFSQKVFIELIALLLNSNELSQVVIPTHTPYILRVIDNLLKANAIFASNSIKEGPINAIIDKDYWLDFVKVSAYYLEEGEIKDAKNDEYQGIDAALFDSISEEISNDFDSLLNIQYP